LGPVIAFIICFFVMIGQGYAQFLSGTVDWIGMAAAYIGLPLFFVLYVGYKIKYRTRLIRLQDCRFKDR
jgi:lysine-specific permease